MFNRSAEQIFVLHPWGAGGGIISAILSLDNQTAALNFKDYPVEDKFQQIINHLDDKSDDAHAYGFLHFTSKPYLYALLDADSKERYIQKGHLYELFSPEAKIFLDSMPNKKSIGVSISERDMEQLIKIRSNIDAPATPYNLYQQWMYNNQKTLLPEYFGINCLHTIEFNDLLDQEKFLDHMMYCVEILNLNINMDLVKIIISKWQNKLKQG